MKFWHPVLLFTLFSLVTVAGNESEKASAGEFPGGISGGDPGAAGELEPPDEVHSDGYSEGSDPVAEVASGSGARRSQPEGFVYGAGNGEQDREAASGTWIERGFSLFGYLLMIGAIIVAFLWLFRNHPRFRGDKNVSTRSLRVAETRPLGQKQFLAIVECDERRILVGFSPGRMDFLCNLSQAIEANPNEEGNLPARRQ